MGNATGASSPFVESTNGGPLDEEALVLLYAPGYSRHHAAYSLAKAAVTSVGRDPRCSVVVEENGVSREHAIIAWSAGAGWTIQDRGSRNGTIVDGAKVENAPLEHGSQVHIGDAIFKFVAQNGRAYEAFSIGDENQTRGKWLVGGFQVGRIADEIARVAPSDLSCLILGETGTGKELAAVTLHELSRRRGNLQAVNCAAIPQNLIESELFGYKKGAFSGALQDKPGLVRLAHEGTLFLDEIGDMPLEAQAKLLRILQSKEVFPVGSTTSEKVNVRVCAATHRHLPTLVKAGAFRGDLFARLHEHTVTLPSLRDRKEDIFRLARHFCLKHAGGERRMTFAFLLGLLHYDWPYNVRELESAMKRALTLAADETLDSKHLPDTIREVMADYGQVQLPSAQAKAPSEDDLRAALVEEGGNVAKVARRFGKERMQIHRWLRKYSIDLQSYR